MKKIIVLTLGLFVLNSCSNEQEASGLEQEVLTETSFKGAAFDDWESFNERHKFLQDQEDEYSTLFEVSKEDYTSFLSLAVNTEDEEELKIADNLTIGLMGILNKDLQFKVGEKIISYKNQGFYESDLKFSSFKESGDIEIKSIILENVDSDKELNLAARLYVGGRNTAGYSHRDFNMRQSRRCSDNSIIYGPGSRTMRFTQQLKSFRASRTQYLFIETKLYWRNRRNKTRFADGEYRNYTYNISGTLGVRGGLYNTFVVIPINLQKTVNCTRNRYNQQDLSGGGAAVINANPWQVNLTGTITHHINGDSYSNRWVAPVNW